MFVTVFGKPLGNLELTEIHVDVCYSKQLLDKIIKSP